MAKNNTMIKVDGVKVKTPSEFSWGLNDVSNSDAGRTQDALMHKNRLTRKRKIKLKWTMLSPEDAQAILIAFAPEYFDVTYFDPLIGGLTTKKFYSGDQEMPVKIWTVGNKKYESLTLDIIER